MSNSRSPFLTDSSLPCTTRKSDSSPMGAELDEKEPSDRALGEAVAGSIAAKYAVARDAMEKLYRNVSAPIRELDLLALAESKLSIPTGPDANAGKDSRATRFECLRPDGSIRIIDSSEFKTTILVNSDLDDQEKITMGSAIRLPSLGLSTLSDRKGRSLSGVSTTVSGMGLGEEPAEFLAPGGSRLLHRRTKRFHTVAAGLASEARAAAESVRQESRELLPS